MDPDVAAAKGVVKEFFRNLKGEPEKALQAGAPTSAVKVCHTRAHQIGAEMSAKTRWDVG